MILLNVFSIWYLSILIGAVQYYSYKPIPMGQELLLFYGDEYFTDLGYQVCREEPNMGKFSL